MAGDGMDWLEMKKCRSCGKKFAVLYPHLWRYKRARGSKTDYFCSWGCLRRYDGKGKDEMNDQMEIARELAEAMERGEDPKEFLKGKGYKNPYKAYANIKNKCKEKDPELAEKFGDRREKKAEVKIVDRLPDAEKLKKAFVPNETRVDFENWDKPEEKPAKRSFSEMKKPAEEPLEVASVYSRVIDGAIYRKLEGGRMYLVRGTTAIELTAYQWFKLTEEILVAIRQLDITRPSRTLEPEEYTGNNGPLK